MTSITVNTITDNTNSFSTSPLRNKKHHAWSSFSKNPAGIIVSHGLSSYVDAGVGEPWFYLTYSLESINSGASNLCGAEWTAYEEYPLQAGSRIEETNRVAGFCGSSNTGRGDWRLGYFALNGV